MLTSSILESFSREVRKIRSGRCFSFFLTHVSLKAEPAKKAKRMIKEMSPALKELTVKWERQIFEERITRP